MPTTKPNKQKSKDTHIIDSKPVQLAKIMYAAIVRYVKAKDARIGDEKANFMLDVERKGRYIVDSDI